MKKFMTVMVAVLVLLSVNVQAKTIVALIKGGVQTFLPGGDDLLAYDPLDRYGSESPEEIARYHGLDALAVYLANHMEEDLVSRVFVYDVSPRGCTTGL